MSDAAATATCGKCDGGGAAVAVAGGVGLCVDCFRAHLFGKFKLAVTSNAMVRPTDAVLLAFSGGPASRSPVIPISSPSLFISMPSLHRVIWEKPCTVTRDQCTTGTQFSLFFPFLISRPSLYRVIWAANLGKLCTVTKDQYITSRKEKGSMDTANIYSVGFEPYYNLQNHGLQDNQFGCFYVASLELFCYDPLSVSVAAQT